MRLGLTTADWIVAFFLLGGSLALGLYLALRGRVGENSANYFLAGRRMVWPVIGASYFATNIGAEHLVGLSGDAYRYGLCAGAVEMTTFITLGVSSAILFPYFIKNKIFTIPEFLELRFAPAARHFFSGFMIVICIMTKMAFSLYAGALVLSTLLGWNVMGTVVTLGIFCAIFTMIGGFAAVAYTDTIQTIIIIVGCTITLFIGLDKVGGWDALIVKVPESMSLAKPFDDPNYPFWGILIGAIFSGTFYWGIDQVNVQRVLSAKDLNHARWGAMFATLLKITPIFIFALPGVIAMAVFPGREAKLTFVTVLNDFLPSGLRGMVLAALLAALISSLDSAMNGVSTLVVRDFALRLRSDMKEKTQVFIGRVAILVATLFGIGAAYLVYKTPEGLYKYLQTISIYLTMPVIPAIIFGVMSKRVTVKGGLVSVFVGIILSAIFVADQLMGVDAGQRLFPWLHTKLTLNYTYRGLLGTGIVTAVLFAVSAFTKKSDPERLQKTTIDWSQKIEKFAGWVDWRLHWTVLTIITVLVYIWMW